MYISQSENRKLFCMRSPRDSESDWDTAAESDAETQSPKRLKNPYPKFERIPEVPEENWNNKNSVTPKIAKKSTYVEYKQYNTEDEEEQDVITKNNVIQQNAAKKNLIGQNANKAGDSGLRSNTPEQNFGDFKSTLTEQSALSCPEKSKPPGKDRKGNLYDPVSGTKDDQQDIEYNFTNWDSDDDAKALADLREGFKKGKLAEEQAQRKVDSTAIVLEVKEPDSPAKPAIQRQETVEVASPRVVAESSNNNKQALRSGQAYVQEDDEETRIIYPFEDGQKEFYHAIEGPSKAFLPGVADRIELYIRRGWQEFFAALRILTGFVFIFLVELLLFLIRDTVYKLSVKIIVIFGNFLVKPLLSNVFNAIIQPVLVFLWNIFAAIRNMFEPIIDILRSIAHQIAVVLEALRLVNINLQFGGYGNEHMLHQSSNQQHVVGVRA